MKCWPLFLLFPLIFEASAADTGITGKVASSKACSPKVMVWLSLDKDNYQERLLLLHTEVPVGGKFQFYLKPGNYQLRASDELGCEFFQRVKVSDKLINVPVKLVSK